MVLSPLWIRMGARPFVVLEVPHMRSPLPVEGDVSHAHKGFIGRGRGSMAGRMG